MRFRLTRLHSLYGPSDCYVRIVVYKNGNGSSMLCEDGLSWKTYLYYARETKKHLLGQLNDKRTKNRID